MKKKLPLFLLFLLGACRGETSTFVVRSLQFSNEDSPIEFDADHDGNDDNQLPEWNAIWRVLGFPVEEKYQELLTQGEFSIGFDLTEDTFRGLTLRGYRASFVGGTRLDGSDLITPIDETFFFDNTILEQPLFSGDGGFLEAQSERFIWPLVPFESKEPIELPLERVSVSGSWQGTELTAGKILGLVSASSVSSMLEKIPAALQEQLELDARAYNNQEAPIPCEGTEDHAALVCQTQSSVGFCSDGSPDGIVTGLCLPQDSISAIVVSFLDEDGDGRFVVDFDENTGRFLQNELSLLFGINTKTGAPEGLFGDLFQIDQNSDGIKDSMAVAIGFEAVFAQRK
jgi:hypothetical protein